MKFHTCCHTKLLSRHIIHLAFFVWSCFTELTFEVVKNVEKTDIFIKFSVGKHGYLDNISKKIKKDDGNPFDGPHGKYHQFRIIASH